MKAWLLVLALLPAEAGASSPAPKDDLGSRIRKLLPAGWTVETRGLAAEVLAVFHGPKQAAGEATVTVARLAPHVTTSQDAAAVAAAFEGAQMPVSYREQGAFGGPELESSRGGLMVRQWVVNGPVSYLVTAAAPKVMIEQTALEIAKAVEALRHAKIKPEDATLDTKPTKRPDGAQLGAKAGQAD